MRNNAVLVMCRNRDFYACRRHRLSWTATLNQMMSCLLFLLWVLLATCIASAHGAATDCDQFTPFGQPAYRSLPTELGIRTRPDWVVICHSGQMVAFNPRHNVSDWVAFRLRREDLLNPTAERKDSFRSDPKVPPKHRVVKSDYTHSGYDRGHLAPAAAMKWSCKAMRDSFLMSNISPQVGAGFNQHIWKSLERKMRQWACLRGMLYVVTGPLYETRPIARIAYDKDGDGNDDNGILVAVPSHFFKLAIDPRQMEAIAFVLPNKSLETKDLPKYLTSIDDIEARSHLDVLTSLWDGTEQAIESHVQPRLWEEPDNEPCKAIQ